MKKYTFLLLAFLSLSQLAVAQEVNVEPQRGQRGSFHFGIITGLNSTWIKVDNEEEANRHYRYKSTFKMAPIGAALGYKFNTRHDFQAEAYISNQGQDYKLTANGDGSGEQIGEKRIELQYLQTALFWKFTGGDVTRFNLHFGPQLGFLLKGEEVNEFTQTATDGKKTIPAGTYTLAKKEKGGPIDTKVGGFNNLEPYVVLGFGVEQDIIPNLYVSGVLRFNYGFKDIRDQETTQDAYDLDKYILRYNIYGGLQLGLHYTFGKQ